MDDINVTKNNLNNRSYVFCTFGLLIALAALPAFGQQIHQLSYNNSYWADQNLNGVQTNNFSVAAFTTTPNNQMHVYYLSHGNPSHVHQLFYNGVSWADQDLTALTGGPGGQSAITGFSVGNYQYVYYISETVPRHVHQLLYNNVAWVDSDLSVLSGTGAHDAGFVGLVAFTTTPALHVYYLRDLNGSGLADVHQLFSGNGTTWQDQDLTTLTGSPQALTLPTGLNIGNRQYVYYTDSIDGVHQLNYNNSKWMHTDLTALTQTPPSIQRIASFVIPGTTKMRLYFQSQSNNHLLQLASSNGTTWTSTDLSNKTQGQLPDAGSPIVAYVTTPNNGVHVFYIGLRHIYQTYQSTATTWTSEDLTSSGNGYLADPVSNLAGFSLQNEQFVFYHGVWAP